MEKDGEGRHKNISERHSIFVSRLFGSPLFHTLRGKILGINTSGVCHESNMVATGIPPHIEISRTLVQ